MNVAAYKFKEYGTMNSKGIVTTPASNVVTFTHSSGNKQYETVLSADEVASYTVANIFGTWAPDVIASQKTVESATLSGNTISWKASEGATAYAIVADRKIIAIVPAATTSFTLPQTDALTAYAVRAANSKGGFGPAVDAVAGGADGISNVIVTTNASKQKYNLAGQRVGAAAKGIIIVDGAKYMVK